MAILYGMAGDNLFTLLSSFRPGAAASPFENYCTSGLAYFLQHGHGQLCDLFADAAGCPGQKVVAAEVQPMLAGAGFADMVLTFDQGNRCLVEVQVEPGYEPQTIETLEEHARYWREKPQMVFLTLPGVAAPEAWSRLSWVDCADAIESGGSEIEWQFAEFIRRDILGLGPVPLEQAIASNRLYALGAAAIRRRFGTRARYVNSASRPIGGRYRYLGTTFAVDGSDMEFWAGIVNEAVPLNEHYYLMLASKVVAIEQPVETPRPTSDWKWAHWTGGGRVVRPITVEMYDELLARLPFEA